MKKKEFVKELQKKIETKTGDRPTYDEARDYLDSVVDIMEMALINGKAFRFRGFGRFEFRKREGFERETHVKAGEKVDQPFVTKVEPHVIAYFKPSKKLNEKLTRRLGPILLEDEEE